MAELDLLLLMIEDKDYYEVINESLDIEDFSNDEFKRIYKIIIQEYNNKTTIDRDSILDIYSKQSSNEDIINALKNHNIAYKATEIDIIIKDLINTLIYYKLENQRKEILEKIEILEKKDRNSEEDEMFLKYCLDLTKLNNEIKSIRHR